MDELGGGPVGLGVADTEEEVAQQLGSLRCVPDLGVELHRPDVARGIGDAGHGIGGAGGERKAGGQFQGFIAMGHPDVERFREAGKQRNLRAGHDGDLGMAVLALIRGAHLAAEMMSDKLQAIADAEDRESQGQDGGIGGRCVRVVNGAGASGEDQADGMMGSDFSDGSGTGKDDGEDILLSDAAGDELGVLAAKIQDDDRGGIHVLVFQPFWISVNRSRRRVIGMVEAPELNERG